MAELTVRVDSARGIDDLRSLLAWLKRDQALLGHVEAGRESIEADQMGMLTAVVVTLSGGAVSAFAEACAPGSSNAGPICQ